MAYALGSPQRYGTLAVVLSILTLLRTLLSFGLPQATAKFVAQNPTHEAYILRKSLNVQHTYSAVLLLTFIAGIPLWTYLLKDVSLSKYLLLVSVLIPLVGIMQVYHGYLNGQKHFGSQAFYLSFYSIARVIFALLLAFIGFQVSGVISGFIVAAIITVLLMRQKIRKKFEDAPDILSAAQLVNFSVPILIFSFGLAFVLNLDLFLLKRFFPDSAAIGYYAGAMNIAKIPYFLFHAVTITIFPIVAELLGKGDIALANARVKKALTYFLMGAIPFATVVMAKSKHVLELMYPIIYGSAAGPLGVLIFSMSILAFFYALVSIIIAADMPWVSVGLIALCIVFQVGAGLSLIPKYQMMGAAASSILTTILGTILASIVVFRRIGNFIDPKKTLIILTSSVVLLLILRALPDFRYPLLPLVCLAAFVIYAIMMVLLGGIGHDEIKSLKSILKK